MTLPQGMSALYGMSSEDSPQAVLRVCLLKHAYAGRVTRSAASPVVGAQVPAMLPSHSEV